MATEVSDQKREEIAGELRYISGHPPEWATSASVIAEFLDADYPVKWRDSGELFSMLADLIARGTCRDVSKPGGGFECSECKFKAEIVGEDCNEYGEVFSTTLMPRFCPNCGRKVVNAS